MKNHENNKYIYTYDFIGVVNTRVDPSGCPGNKI